MYVHVHVPDPGTIDLGQKNFLKFLCATCYLLYLPTLPTYPIPAGTEDVPGDEVYEKAVNTATVVYQLEGEAEKIQFVPIHENSAKMLQVSILHPTRVS